MHARLPAKKDLALVWAVIVSILYGWSIVVFFWKMPAWLLFLQIEEVLVIFAYVLSMLLLASLGFLSLLAVLCVALPAQYLQSDFSARGAYLSFWFWGVLALYTSLYAEYGGEVHSFWFLFMVAGIGLGVLFSYLSFQYMPVRSFILWLADRLTIFLYILIPLSVVALIVIILRNVM